jgi:hypothetical protein
MGVRGATKAGRYGILRRWGAEKYLGFCVWGLACSTFPLRAGTGSGCRFESGTFSVTWLSHSLAPLSSGFT